MSQGGTPILSLDKRFQNVIVDGRFSAASDEASELPVGASATPPSTLRRLLNRNAVPLAVAAVIGGTSRVFQIREVPLGPYASTAMMVIDWNIEDELFWEPVRERITNEQVRSLNALLAIPFVGEHDFQYLSDD